MKKKLQKRLCYLWTFELINAFIIFPLLYHKLSQTFDLGWFSLASLIVVCAILVIGASFWFLKERALSVGKPVNRPRVRRFYRGTKAILLAPLLALPALFAVRAFGPEHTPLSDLIVGGAFAIMAILEYVNYYHVQLSYDNRADLEYLLTHRRLKRATMVRDLNI